MTAPTDKTFNQNMTLLPKLTFYRIAREVLEYLRRVKHAKGNTHSSEHLVSSHLELTCSLLLETNTFPLLVVIFRTLPCDNSNVFSLLYLNTCKMKNYMKNTKQTIEKDYWMHMIFQIYFHIQYVYDTSNIHVLPLFVRNSVSFRPHCTCLSMMFPYSSKLINVFSIILPRLN